MRAVILNETEELYRQHDEHERDRDAQDTITEQRAAEALGEDGDYAGYSEWCAQREQANRL